MSIIIRTRIFHASSSNNSTYEGSLCRNIRTQTNKNHSNKIMSSRLLIRLATTGKPVLFPRSSPHNYYKNKNNHNSPANNCCFQPPIRRIKVTTPSGGIVEEPKRVPLGLFYVGLTIIAGYFIGATISESMANFLEEFDIFAPADDDD